MSKYFTLITHPYYLMMIQKIKSYLTTLLKVSQIKNREYIWNINLFTPLLQCTI